MEKILVTGHKNPDTDSICSAIVMAYMQTQKRGEECEAVRLGELNKETEYALKYFGVEKPRLIENVEEGQKIILVDHNEFTQSVDGIEKAKIDTVVDHHRIANFQTSEPLYYIAEPVGCTATILYELCLMNNQELDSKKAGLLLSAIISDTLLFKSPTSTAKDEEMANKLAKIANVDINIYGLEMLKAGTELDSFTPEQLINLDAKNFETNGVKYRIAQVNTVDIAKVLERQESIENEMNKYIAENGVELFVFAITDILNSNSEIIALGKRTDIIEKENKLENNRAFLEGVVSRKKQLVPLVDRNIG